MITVEEAVTSAKTQISLLFPDLARDLRLEEAETPLTLGNRWRFTFSMTAPEHADGEESPLARLMRSSRTRKFVELAPEGDLLSIKDR